MPNNHKTARKGKNKPSFVCFTRFFALTGLVFVYLPFHRINEIYPAAGSNEQSGVLVPEILPWFLSSSNNQEETISSWSSGNDGVTIAYAVSITDCPRPRSAHSVVDGAAVLAHSIHWNSRRESNSRYDYHLYAFVHPDAANCTQHLPKLNYTIKVVETPINISLIQNEKYRARLQSPTAGCCKEKEFLKLYSLTLDEYPIVVHFDLDTMLLKPLDDLYDLMLQPDTAPKTVGSYAMWPNDWVVSRRIESFFTRDYPMGNPNWKIEHYGVQGGFWIVRPNRNTFQELCSLVLEGNFSGGWYDSDTKYPGFYGAAMIQGLLGFYYGHLHPDAAVELNRCQFNNMADNPLSRSTGTCSVPLVGNNSECEDCRATEHSLVHSLHTTFCRKPWSCPIHSSDIGGGMCHYFLSSWYRTRHHLESVAWGVQDASGPKDSYGYQYCSRRQYHALNLSHVS